MNQLLLMTIAAKKLADNALALSEEERMDIFVQLATSLPAKKTMIAESARRAEEMKNGTVIAMTEVEFQSKMDRLGENIR